jgi:hypothetical protein
VGGELWADLVVYYSTLRTLRALMELELENANIALAAASSVRKLREVGEKLLSEIRPRIITSESED